MRWVLVLCLFGLLPLASPAPAAVESVSPSIDAPIDAPFDAAMLDAAETRLLQAALAVSGDYTGLLDGHWTGASAAALADWSQREFGRAPLGAHAAAAVAGLLEAVRADGWRELWLDELGLAIALPVDRLAAPSDEAGGVRRWTTDASFSVLTHRFDQAEALAWHDTAEGLAVGGAATYRGPDRLVTVGALADGRGFYTRSDLVAGAWATVYLAADPTAQGALRLAAASIHAGRPQSLELPAGGGLASLLDATARALEAGDAAATAGLPVLTPARFDAAMTALPPRDAGGTAGADGFAIGGTGTGFYVAPRLVLTAAHVIAGCAAPALADGTPLEPVAADDALDVAVLRTPRRAERWLALADDRLRLGQRVYAIGFPYYSIAGTSLTLTGGNVSALAGIDDDARFFSFSAPVQPGNSGGPLLDARGRVRGLVVARLAEDYIVEATGSLPQNVNYALREDELAGFLATAGIAADADGIGRFDPGDGVPEGFEAAIVPVVCR